MGGAHEAAGLGQHHASTAFDKRGRFLDRRDPRAKVLAAFALILGVVLVPQGDARRLASFTLPVLVWACLGSAPPWRVLLRATVVLPFAIPAVFLLPFTAPVPMEGLARAGEIVARALLAGTVLAGLAYATETVDLVQGLAGLGMPRAIVLTTGFTVRYLDLLREEMRRLQLARELRTFTFRPALALRAMGHVAGTLFVRTYERAERVHAAMVARGFDGRFPSLAPSRIALADVALVIACVSVTTTLLLFARTS